jgi:hypothetical protein
MTRETFELEIENYIGQTEFVKLPEGDHLASFIDFASEALALIRSFWPAESIAWSHALEARRKGSLSMVQWREIQEKISVYRNHIGESSGMDRPHSEQAAISFLFALAIESPQASIHEYCSPQISRALDEFSIEFIKYFGKSQEVLAALRRNFHVISNA